MDTDWFFLSKQYVTMQYKHGKMFYSLKSYILQCDICMFYNMILPRMTVLVVLILLQTVTDPW